MKNTFGDSISVTLFGESHGASVGVVIDGIAPGIPVDPDYITHRLDLRRPSGQISTARREKDIFRIESGVFNGKTTGTPILIIIPNSDTRSEDYGKLHGIARPGHADFAAYCKFHGFEDTRGGGHFSGRLTAPIVAAGAILLDALKKKGILIGTHLARCAGVSDRCFDDYAKDISFLENTEFPVLDPDSGEAMQEAILAAKDDGDSVGGVLSTAIIGVPAGIGEPWFDSLESKLAHAMFSIGGIKGIEFGDGYRLADMRGSEANDAFEIENGHIITEKNSNGGINGGISNGMPIVFDCVVKPTPSISKKQKTVNYLNAENTVLEVPGRHDPCIAHRARAVVDSLAAIVIADMLALHYGTDFLAD